MSNVTVLSKLPEQAYEAIKLNQYCGSKSDLEDIIANGTPITEGDLISREYLQNLTCGIIDEDGIIHQVVMLADIDNAPSIGGNQNE